MEALAACAALLGIMLTLLAVVATVRLHLTQTYPQAFVVAAVLLLGAVQLSSDLLSVLGVFSATWILAIWSLVALMLLVVVWSKRQELPHWRQRCPSRR